MRNSQDIKIMINIEFQNSFSYDMILEKTEFDNIRCYFEIE